jgi:O-antigen ligase
LILIVLLPFHAFLVTVLTKWIEGPGHAPMGEIAIWKEAVLAMILLIALIEIASSFQLSAFKKRMDALDGLIITLFVVGILVSISQQLEARSLIYGVRYDFVPLITFLILRRVPWSREFFQKALVVIGGTGLTVAVLGIASYFFPESFFTRLGYSDLHSLYVPGGPLAPFQQIGGTAIRRIQSVMSGPNQLGLWLLIPLAIATSFGLRASRVPRNSQLIVLVAALVLTFSRAAWIGAAVIIGITLWPVVRSLSRRTTVGLMLCAACFLAVFTLTFPSIILRAASSRGHLENPLRAVQTMIAHPLGLGLGTAGPASNRTSDACVMLEESSDPSWAKDRPDLCVFVGDVQVQPSDRTCSCPFLPENWYLQIGVEMGWLGMALYIALIVLILLRLWQAHQDAQKESSGYFAWYIFTVLLAISVAALFLHAWEDSAVAYTVWLLIASRLQSVPLSASEKHL